MIIVDAIICSVSGLAAYFDFRFRRIPNWLVIAGLLLGLIANGYLGNGQLMQSVLGFVAGITILFVPFAFGWVGAGDVKYFGVIGALLGVGWLPRVFFYSVLAAGSLAVIYLATGTIRELRFRQFWSDFKLALLSRGALRPQPVSSRGRAGSVPWGVAFAAGTIFAYYFDRAGAWAGF